MTDAASATLRIATFFPFLLLTVFHAGCGGTSEPRDDSKASCRARLDSVKGHGPTYDQVVSCLAVLPKDAWEPWIALGLRLAKTDFERARIEHDAALLADRLGRYHEALRLAEKAANIFESEEKLAWQAAALFNQGTFLSALGRGSQALDRLDQALGIYRGLPDRDDDVAKTLAQIGWVFFLLDDAGRAVQQLEEAADRHTLAMARAATLDRLGSVYRRLGRTSEAEEVYAEALELLEENPLSGHVIANLGWVQLDRQRSVEARQLLEKALPVLRRLGDVDAVTHTLAGLAAAERDQGRLDAAIAYLTEALEIVESLHEQAGSRKLRASFLALRQDYFLQMVDLSAELHARRPSQGWDVKALVNEEKRRARALLDAMQRLPERRYPADVEATLELRDRITLLERVLRQNADPDAARRLKSDLRRAIGEYEMLQSASVGLGAPVTRLPIPTVAELQALLDDQTSVLVYSLGPRRSLLFYLDSDALDIFELPPASEIEELATLFSHAVRAGRHPFNQPMVEATGARLAEILLAPVIDRLRPRVRFVRDGRLHLVPFSALPKPAAVPKPTAGPKPTALPTASASKPDDEPELLIREFRLVAIPSLTTLALLHDRSSGREAEGIAVLAPDVPGGRMVTDSRFPLLPGVVSEVHAIRRIAGPERLSEALGRRAGRQALSELTREPLFALHVAAHGWVYRDLPELSTLVLTDADGHDDYLRLPDLFHLQVDARLVVLSACETAVGEILDGEGMVGMSNAFLSAGAASVLASLWPVQDQSTSELMALFYEQLLIENKAPDEALQRAQLALVDRRGETAVAYHWAAFELHGF